MQRPSRLVIAVAVCAALALSPLPARAATFTVTRFDDPAPDGCAAGDCSLREAIIASNVAVGTDEISLPAGTFTLALPGTDEDAAADGDLDITDGLTLTGAGAGATVIDGDGAVTGERVFQLVLAPTVEIAGLTIRGGRQSGATQGGGIMVTSGSLSLHDAVVTDNQGGGMGFGSGGVHVGSGASATLTRVRVTENFTSPATQGWGGGLGSAGTLSVTDSEISGNAAGSGAGGIVVPTGTTTITNTTISGNTAANGIGGGAHSAGTLRLFASTVADNGASGHGGGLYRLGGTLELAGSLVANNTSGGVGQDCNATIVSAGDNLVRDPNGCTGLEPTDLTGVDPLLGPLADNGGPTMTHALAPGSPAVDAANAATAPALDQRGVARNPDIGAYELAFCLGVVVNRVGTDGADTLVGTPGADGMLGLGGNDVIDGGQGADAICGGPGTDTADYSSRKKPLSLSLDGVANDGEKNEGDDLDVEGVIAGSGKDTLVGKPGEANVLDGGPGADTVDYSSHPAGVMVDLVAGTAVGGSADDLVAIEDVIGTPFADVLRGDGNRNRLDGLKGKDILVGRGGKDTLLGKGGKDTLKGGGGKDLLKGGGGKDRLAGQGGPDILRGQGGPDVLKGGGGKDRLYGNAGNDSLNGGRGKKDLCKVGGGKKDTTKNCELP